jgi:hypothetical protein
VKRDREYIAKKRKEKARPKPKPKSKRPHGPQPHKVQDKAPCRTCGLQLWEHPRCTECNRFVWCTDELRTASGDLIHAHGCPVEL